ncbi:DUF6146 family protein [Flavobacterium sp. TMP13]|uniref:DUF6146 family protein n=1 Tax=Flavobacterium sp. TMP13 TaxID=3425950 RepID=UPI003D777A0E
MKNSFYFITLFCIILGCSATKTSTNTAIAATDVTTAVSDTVRIANDELEYEVLIIDPGFSSWLVSRAYPRNYYSQSYLENKNQNYIIEWNSRALQPLRYDSNLYEMTINYDLTTDYGYEVNYLIYNYMIYFQNTYKQRLAGYVPSR